MSTKIPCNVTFVVNSFDGFTEGQDELGFAVSPPSYQIPPFECIYVNVSFSPTTIKVSICLFKKIVSQFKLITFNYCHLKAYSAIFEASVDGTKDSNFTFEIFGEGVLPYLRVLKPVQRSDSNNLILNFQKVHVHHKETLPIQVLNEGVLPCNVRMHFLLRYLI